MDSGCVISLGSEEDLSYGRGSSGWHPEYIRLFFLMCYFEIIIGVREVEEIYTESHVSSASFPEWLHLT